MKKWLIVACCCIVVSIVLGAFGAHALKEKLDADQLVSFETGVRYLMYGGLSLLILPFVIEKYNFNFSVLNWIFIGTLLFSGSIFMLTLKTLTGFESMGKIVGPITPIGGLLMIIGWLLFIIKLIKKS